MVSVNAVRNSALILALLLLGLLLPATTVARGDPPPEEVFIPEVTGYPQTWDLSCESRSAVDLAAFWDVTVGEGSFVEALPRSDNPHEGFVGDVSDPPGSLPPNGYGVYARPVADTLRRYGLDAQAHQWLGLEELQWQLADGRPVVVWATYDMRQAEIIPWTTAGGSEVAIVQWEHTFIAVGYDAQGIFLVDAYDGETKYYTFEAFVAAWMQLDEMAVTVDGPLSAPLYPWEMVRSRGTGGWLLDGRSLSGPY